LFAKCDPAYGEGVAKALKLEPSGGDRSSKEAGATGKPKRTSTAA